MKYSYNWLKELSGTKKSPKELADLLTMHSFELEETKTEGKETQLTFDVLANRGHDALSHIGMAREICACEGRGFKNGDSISIREIESPNRRLKVEIKDKKLCRRYIGAMLDGIEVAPSPQWMQERLLVCGIKPINNIVDITNYAMLETGQPLHSFDFDKIEREFPISNFQFPNKSQNQNPKINIFIRKARKNEKIILLDEKEYTLNENNLVIADSQKSLALAGVMGGLDSGITDKTTSIVLEAANFDPVNIRKTRVEHGLNTESSYRFERDIDPNLAEMAARRAVELIQKYGGKKVKVMSFSDIYSKKIKPWTIRLDLNYVNRLLGENIPKAKIKNILENLGMKVLGSLASKWEVEIPTVRIDLKTQEDLIEEIGRIYGYENIPAKAPMVELSSPAVNEQRVFENKLRDILCGLGFSEMLNYSFYSAGDIEKCGLGIEGHYEVANPMNPDQQYMRRALIPNLLKNIKFNQNNFEDIKIFEIGHKYRDEKLAMPKEMNILNGMLARAKDNNPFFALKGALEAALSKIGCIDYEYVDHKVKFPIWHPSRVAEIHINGKKIGKIGEINPAVCKAYGISSRVASFGITIEKIIGFASKEKIFQSISKFPSVKRDISMFLNGEIEYADIEKKIYNSGGKLVLAVDLFDIFEKEGEKSLAIRIEIGSSEKTLTSEEIDTTMKKIIERLEKDLKVKVRK
jgi:phenylalanyl-tRNA synthetase beta chain